MPEEKLKDVMPREFMGAEYEDCEARKHADVVVVKQHQRAMFTDSWPGKHCYVNYWAELANGKIVGFNENPAKGWSFPVMNKPKVQ